MDSLEMREVSIKHRHGKKPIKGFTIGPKDQPAWVGAWYKDGYLASLFRNYTIERELGFNP